MALKKLNSGILELDIHGMNAYQAKTCIDGVLKKADRSIYRIRIIHGYRGGTALKEMVYQEYQGHPKVIRLEGGWNEGTTDVVLREL
ncbi:MAG TPA: Smr/MutS family protein [Mobilitalea sp.]|nr:Smr/MutS family protein [Mobilitalea sp.]